jgi:hypothetical protein
MPIILAIIGAFFSGLMMWIIWGNGMAVINQWLDTRAERARTEKDAKAIAEARERALSAPLRAITDPREGALVLLSRLAMERGEITAEQNVMLSQIATGRMGLPGKAEHHTTLAAFAARQAPGADRLVADLTPLLHVELSIEEKDDFFRLMDEIAALHGGPTDAQEAMIERVRRRMGFARKAE